MELKFWTYRQEPLIHRLTKERIIPAPVEMAALEIIGIMDGEYGEERQFDQVGGYVLIYTECLDLEKDIPRIRKRNHITTDPELESVTCTQDGVDWKFEWYLLTDDFGICLLYPQQGSNWG